tara:strand:- start:97 stop:306 length:210 start_codon:yes stop_codon:yes gene_type:complete
MEMNIGSVVKLREVYESAFYSSKLFGIVLDIYENNDGYEWYEVQFENQRGWFEKFELELISENRRSDKR